MRKLKGGSGLSGLLVLYIQGRWLLLLGAPPKCFIWPLVPLIALQRPNSVLVLQLQSLQVLEQWLVQLPHRNALMSLAFGARLS